AFGIAFAKRGAALEIVNVVNEMPVLAETAATVVIFDPTPLIEALEEQAQRLVDHAAARAREAGVTARTRVIHGYPVQAIVDAAREDDQQLIVMGTHARSGLPRTFLGST